MVRHVLPSGGKQQSRELASANSRLALTKLTVPLPPPSMPARCPLVGGLFDLGMAPAPFDGGYRGKRNWRAKSENLADCFERS